MKLYIVLTVLLSTTYGEYSQRYRGRPLINYHSHQGNSLINLLTGQKFDNSPYRNGYLNNHYNYGYQNRPYNGNSGLSALASQYLKNSRLKQSLQYDEESGGGNNAPDDKYWNNKHHQEKERSIRPPQENIWSSRIHENNNWSKRALKYNWNNGAQVESAWNNPLENVWSNEVSSNNIWNNRVPSIDVSNQQTISNIQSPITISNQEPIVHKHVYVHVAPPDDEPQSPPKPIILPPPNKTYKIIFVKVPSLTPPPAPIPVLAPRNEEKTLVYVLVKKPESPQQVIIPQPVVEQSKPEVYFIKYRPNNPENQGGLSALSSAGLQSSIGVQGSIGGVNLQIGPQNGNVGSGLLRNSPLLSGSLNNSPNYLLNSATNIISGGQLSQNSLLSTAQSPLSHNSISESQLLTGGSSGGSLSYGGLSGSQLSHNILSEDQLSQNSFTGDHLSQNSFTEGQLSNNAVSSVSVTLNDAHYEVQSQHNSPNSNNIPNLYGSLASNSLVSGQGTPVQEYSDESQNEPDSLSNNFYPQDSKSQEYGPDYSESSETSPNAQSYIRFRSARDSQVQKEEKSDK